MNVLLPEKEKGTKKRIAIYLVIILLCVIAVGISMYQFFADEKLEVILGITKSNEEEIENLKSEFDILFENKIKKTQNSSNVTRIKSDENLVYTVYEKHESSANNYEINVNIPCINIDNNLLKEYNDEIKNVFEVTAEEILKTEGRNIEYTVNYMASIENNILAVAILSKFKDGSNVQRTIVKTYNYDLKNNKEVNLNELIQIKNIEKGEAERTIKKEIEKSQKQAESLKELGYSIFSRNANDSIYKIENSSEFFMYNGNLYIIYAYGNKNSTSEMDLVIM